MRRLGAARREALRRMEVYFPYFSMRVRFSDRRHPPAPPVEGHFHRLLDFAERARWGRRPVEPPAAGAYPFRVIERLVEQIESRFDELRADGGSRR